MTTGTGIRPIRPRGAQRVTHGTRTAYVHDRCRCDACTEANRQYQAALVERLSNSEPLAHMHGMASTYNNWRCRCDACRAAGSVANAAARRRRLARQAKDPHTTCT